jgi:hypothetical protein
MTAVSPVNACRLAGSVLVLSFALTAASSVLAARESLHLDSARVTVSGASNLHPYEASTSVVTLTRVQVFPGAGDRASALMTPGALESFAISIPAATLTSPREGLSTHLQKALKVEQFPDIRFALTRLEPNNAPDQFRGIGQLTIAGVEREVTLALTIQPAGASLNVTGTLVLLMTDYGITPPKAMLGMLKTDPKVTITFATVLSVPTT